VQPDDNTLGELEGVLQGLGELQQLRQVVLQVVVVGREGESITARCEAVVQRLRRALPASAGLEVEFQ
jgi:hypothetical protein